MNDGRRLESQAPGRRVSRLTQYLCLPLALFCVASSAPVSDEPGTSLALLKAAVNDACAPVLSAVIRHSRDEAIRDGARPLPPRLRRQLARYFDDAVLEKTRWTIADDRIGIDTVLAWSVPHYHAVTLDHVIVFFDEEASRKQSIWLHELSHVEQYRKIGLDRFSRHYVANWRKLEANTRSRTSRLMKSLRRDPAEG